MNITEINIEDIKPYAYNAKKHPTKQIQSIANSIKQFGFRQPVVIDENNEIIIGHGRFEAAKKLDMKTIPCVKVDDLSEEQIKALRLVDNKTNESEWDMDLLNNELESILNIDMTQFDFEIGENADDEDIERKDLSDELKLSMRVVIECDSELQQQEIYNEMIERGYVCKIE